MSEVQSYSIVIPARDEEGCIEATLRDLHGALQKNGVAHEIVVVDDGSQDSTACIVEQLRKEISVVRLIKNEGEHGFGRAVICGLNEAKGDAVAIVMADGSDFPDDVVRYWEKLKEGCDCVFGSRFMHGSKVENYPWLKFILNRWANLFLKILFRISLNDTTNAFKAYRREVIEGCRPLIAPHFNLTVEIPLKAIVRGYSWTVIPIGWRGRRTGESKLKIKEMGSRYLFICLYVWLEKYFSRGDYRRKN
ncbi:MAG: glycosyltransferase family 2 protein [Verrucomicrobiota bacterium]